MERLETVLAQRGRELVSLLVRHRTFDAHTAERFVAAAGRDLIRSYRWQLRELRLHGPTRPHTVGDLLHGIHARRIAATLGVSTPQVWRGLRTFVPTVVQMAEAAEVEALPHPVELTSAGAAH